VVSRGFLVRGLLVGVIGSSLESIVSLVGSTDIIDPSDVKVSGTTLKLFDSQTVFPSILVRFFSVPYHHGE
jgi:hypothetical protein